MWLEQIRVVGPLLGEWGKEKYGLKPVKKDALEYLPEYLDHQRDLIHEEQAKALQTDAPVAFVTFKWVFVGSRHTELHCCICLALPDQQVL